jgi:hypothetical protein
MVTTYVPQSEKLNPILHMQVYLALQVYLVLYICKFTLLFTYAITFMLILQPHHYF